jgi:hypothetical protein
VHAGAKAAGRPAPKIFAYVRLAIGLAACDKLAAECAQYAGIPAYASHFQRLGVKPIETAIAAQTPHAVLPALGKW